MATIGRPLIPEPEWCNKIRDGRTDGTLDFSKEMIDTAVSIVKLRPHWGAHAADNNRRGNLHTFFIAAVFVTTLSLSDIV
jgi:hypothetical protein